MGVYLLIEADDDNNWKDLVPSGTDGRRVIGIFSRPDEWCACNNWITEGAKPAGPRHYDPTTGLSICLSCMKFIPSLSFIRNLRRPEDIKEPYKYVNNLGFYPYGLSLPTLQYK